MTSPPFVIAVASADVLPALALPWLHRHGLESVLAFCSLRELAAVGTVSQEWRAAVCHMASLRCSLNHCSDERATQMCASPLRRHVSTIGGTAYCARITCSLLRPLSLLLPHLQRLDVHVQLPLEESLVFPVRLKTLDVEVGRAAGGSDERLAAGFKAAVAAISELAQLEQLTVHLPYGAKFWIDCSLASLARMPSLRSLRLLKAFTLSDAQVAELRALGHLEEVWITSISAPLVCHLLEPPHTLRWQEFIGYDLITEQMAPLLSSLPLRELDAELAASHVDFLAEMPQLTSLDLMLWGKSRLEPKRAMAALSHCVLLRELWLRILDAADLPFTNAQLGACLAQMPHLEQFTLDDIGALTTLSCLTEGSLPRTLTSLNLSSGLCRVPLHEWRHLLQLGALRSLSVHNVFDSRLHADDVALLTPPSQSPLLPHLTTFQQSWMPAA